MDINLKMFKNDWKKNKACNLALLLFMSLSAFLATAAIIIVTRLFASINGMYESALPPHFIQMHKGDIEQEAIDRFNLSYDGVTGWQTVAMIDIYGDDLYITGEESFSLSDCRLDIGLVKQNEKRDLLLDEDRETIQLKEGEIGIPVILRDTYNICLGDEVTLMDGNVTKEFRVAAFVYDAQMNSSLCSSTRMLISDEDYAQLDGKTGEKEYLIEAYLEDSAMAVEYRSAYERESLPKNGQAVTYDMIFLLSAFTDIVRAMIFIMVSMLLTLVSLLCVKYAVLAVMEEELGEIGTMKAIGISYTDIRGFYLNKIRLLALAGCLAGTLAAYLCADGFTAHINRTFGKQALNLQARGMTMAASLLVYGMIILYTRRVLGRLRRVTVVDALVTGKGPDNGMRVKDGIHKYRFLPINLLFGVWEVQRNFKGFSIIASVMCVASILMIIPVNLLQTMKSEKFVTYMGSTLEDIRIEAEPGANLKERCEKINTLLQSDGDVETYNQEKRIRIMTLNEEGRKINLHVDCGENAGKGLNYLEGNAPENGQEIALSSLNAENLGKSVGDVIEVQWGGEDSELRVSGIYQDITSGGYTAKAVKETGGMEAEQYAFTIALKAGPDAEVKAELWSRLLEGGGKVRPMQDFLDQTFGGVVRQMETVVFAACMIGILLAVLLVFLFFQMRFAKDASQIAVMKALGFSDEDVRRQYLYKIMFVSGIGIIIGTLLANLLGDWAVSLAFREMNLGISQITFMGNSLIPWGVIPVILLAAGAVTMWIYSGRVKQCSIISAI